MIFAGIGLIALLAGGYYGYDWFTTGRFMVSTDDAYVGGDIATISPKVPGYVPRSTSSPTRRVKAGDALVTLDDGDYTIARDQAQAAIDTAEADAQAHRRADRRRARPRVTQAEAQKAAAVAAQKNAELAQQRAKSLTASRWARRRRSTPPTRRSTRPTPTSPRPMRRSLRRIANVAVLQGQRAEAASGLKSRAARARQGQSRPGLHRAQGAL